MNGLLDCWQDSRLQSANPAIHQSIFQLAARFMIAFRTRAPVSGFFSILCLVRG